MMRELTERQQMVMRLVARGYSDDEIAETLDISSSTVKNHLACIRRKLGLARRTQIAIYALQQGLIALDEIRLPSPPQPRTETISAAQCFAELGLPIKQEGAEQ